LGKVTSLVAPSSRALSIEANPSELEAVIIELDTGELDSDLLNMLSTNRRKK
jgi:hypothetical protein